MLFLENILTQETIQRLGWTLLHFAWQAAAVALLLAIVLRVLRKSTANLRYIIACLALGLIVLLPIVTMPLVPVVMPYSATNIEPVRPLPVLPTEQTKEIPVAEMPAFEEPVQPEKTGTNFIVLAKQRAAELLEPALPYIVSGWLLGVFGLSLWHLGGWTQLQRLRRKMVKQVDQTLLSKLSQLAQKLGVNRTVQLMESALVQIPTVVGWLRPVILLPASALTGLNSQQLEALLAHELAHIRRYDYLVNMLQTVVEILGFYHPAVWWISYKIRAERENCCDDLAVSISGNRIRYARALTSMEEIRAGRGELAVAASGGNLLVRIRRLVGKESADNSRVSWIPSAITILLIAVIVIPTTFALTARNETEHSAKFLLDKMLEHRYRVRNLQYVAEDNIWEDPAAREVAIEDHIKKMREGGTPERQLERWRRDMNRVPESRYQILKCTIDNAERVKIELTSGTYDSSGKKVPTGDKFVWAWNGVVATDFHQRSVSLGGATIKDDPSIATSIAHPWMSFTGTLCNRLSKAVAAEKQIGVEELKDGTYRISLNDKLGKVVAVINPSQGYTCGLQERYKKNQLSYRETVKYEQVAKGIWFPVGGQRQEYAPDGSLSGKSTVESSQIRINDPAFNASYFDVNMPKGTTVMDEVHGKQYVVGSKRVYDLNEQQKPSTEMEEVDPNSWQEKFYSLYRLEDGQVLKRIAPPFIPERKDYFLLVQPGRYSPNTPHQLVSQYFNWDGKLSIRGARLGGGILRLSTTLESVIGLGNREYDIPPEILNADMSGDWIVRKDTPKEELLQALEQIVKDETGRDIDFVKQKVETEVIVARGKYTLRPLPGVKEKDSVHIYADKMDTYSGAGGGSGTLSKFLRWVGNRVEMNIIDETEAEGVELSWRNHYSADLSRVNLDAELYNQRRDAILNNLTRQTGLTFKREAATVEKWFIAEQESSAESLTIVPMPATSPIPSAEDKTQIRIDCLVVEVPSPLKMDRETTIVAENLLGKKITLRGFPSAAEDLLRKAAEATAEVEDETTSDKRVTQDQFKTLVDMLASRGLMKILMNPTLEVVDGGTAKVQSSQKVPLDRTTMRSTESDYLETKTEYEDVTDSLEITANVLEDDNIILQVEATLALQSTPRGKEQAPLILKQKISTRARVSDGESLIIGGIKKTGKSPAAGINVKDSKEQTTETLLILTPTIVTPETSPEKQADTDNILPDYFRPNDSNKYSIFTLQYISAEKAAELINKDLASRADQLPENILLQPLRDKNQLLVFGNEPGLQMVKDVLKELDVPVDQIQIETRIFTVSEDFFKDIGLDANSISDANAWPGPGPAPFVLPGPDGLGTDSLILDDSHVDFLLKATQTHKDSNILAAPKVMVRDSEEAQFTIHSQFNYISGYTEPNRSSEEPVPKHESVEEGTFLTLKPELIDNNEKISLDFELEIRQLRGIEEHKYKGKYPYQIPQLEVVSTQMRCLVPDGKTLLIGGQKITRKVKSQSSVPILSDVPFVGLLFRRQVETEEQQILLILVKPTIEPPQQAEALRLDRPRPQGIPAPEPGRYGGYGDGAPPGPGKSSYGPYGPIPPAEANDAEKVDSQNFDETSAGRRP